MMEWPKGLGNLFGTHPVGQIGEVSGVVTAVPDDQRLVVLYAHTELTADALWKHLSRSNLPRLWLPKREHFYAVEAIPVLGSGKVDLWAAKLTAMARIEKAARRAGESNGSDTVSSKSTKA